MEIKSIEIKEFTVFDDLKIEFSKGINVFVGENGTGKTHLMKLLYINKNYKEGDDLVELSKYFSCEQMLKPKSIVISGGGCHSKDFGPKNGCATFIPAKDMLTHSKGFLSLCDKFEMPFDKSHYDIISKSLLPRLKNVPEIGKNILPKLEDMMDGTVVVENDVFYVKKSAGDKIQFSVEAEGIKKIAMIWQLIMNESIATGSKLIWDEPDANINPKFLKPVAEILLELSRNGVQIFLATHNYIFAKYIEVLMERDDDISFHSLYTTLGAGVQCETKYSFRDLKNNSIISTFDVLMDEIFDLDLGVV